MRKALQLSLTARLSLALAIFLALLAAGALMAARGGSMPDAAQLAGMGDGQVFAQVVGPTPPAGHGGLLVVGEGEVMAAPDVAFVTLGVQAEGKTAREAMDQNSTAMAAVVDAIKGAGIAEKDIQTTGLSLTPIFSQQRPGDQTPPQIVGYRAANNVNVTASAVNRVGEVIDAAVSAGANVAGGVRFGIRDDAALRRSALDAAVRAARAEADTMAAALGVRVTGVLSATDLNGADTPPRPLAVQADAARGAAPPIQPGELTLRARVQVVYSFG
jgi:uncharacterized protein YggE